jgi:very-short-patch-repair endonuclease/restriction endonuclease S subunit
LADKWQVFSLDQLYDFSSGLSKPRSEFGSGHPFLSFKDVFYNIFVPNELTELVNSTASERASRSIKRGDVFVTRTSETMDELGMSCVALRDIPDATFNGFTKRLRPRSDTLVVPEYAGYFFRSPRFRREVTAMSSLSTRASLNNEMLSRLSIALPPVGVQIAIGQILKALDDKIELNRRMNETLDAIARALFRSWFIDFDPVRRNAARARNQPSPGASRHPRPGGEGTDDSRGRGGRTYRGGYEFSGLVERARELRRSHTPAEDVLWELVRGRQFMGLKFRRQHQIGDYVVDFFCNEQKLVIELDGPVHADPQRSAKDKTRDAYLESMGLNALRFKNEDFLANPEATLRSIAEKLPSPAGRGAGGEGSVEELDRLFPDSFEESALGEIPKGWRASTIGDEAQTILGGTPSRVEPGYWGGDVPWINSGKANEFRIIDPSEFITKDGFDSSATKLLPSRTTVIAITGATMGQVSLTEIATCANQSIVGVIGRAALPSEFLYFWVKSRIDDLLAWQTGGAQQHINKNNVNDLRVLLPDEMIMAAFVGLTRPCFDRIKECCLENGSLSSLRDALLPKLISGELRVKDAEDEDFLEARA